jgi:hypothetical protein
MNPTSNGLFGQETLTKPIPERFVEKRQGQESNIAGKLLEQAIERAFAVRDIHVTRYSDSGGLGQSDLLARRRLVRRVPYTSIYGARSYTEFVYCHGDDLRVRIECKSQQVAGSVDEKFPYLLWNAQQTMPEPAVWFIIEGIGARAKAMQWLKTEAQRTRKKTIRVFTLAEARRAIKRLVEQGVA